MSESILPTPCALRRVMAFHPHFSKLIKEISFDLKGGAIVNVPATQKLVFELTTGTTWIPELADEEGKGKQDTFANAPANMLVARRQSVLAIICFDRRIGEAQHWQHYAIRPFYGHRHNYLMVRLVEWIMTEYPRDTITPVHVQGNWDVNFAGNWVFEKQNVCIELQNFLSGSCSVLSDVHMASVIRKFLAVCHHWWYNPQRRNLVEDSKFLVEDSKTFLDTSDLKLLSLPTVWLDDRYWCMYDPRSLEFNDLRSLESFGFGPRVQSNPVTLGGVEVDTTWTCAVREIRNDRQVRGVDDDNKPFNAGLPWSSAYKYWVEADQSPEAEVARSCCIFLAMCAKRDGNVLSIVIPHLQLRGRLWELTHVNCHAPYKAQLKRMCNKFSEKDPHAFWFLLKNASETKAPPRSATSPPSVRLPPLDSRKIVERNMLAMAAGLSANTSRYQPEVSRLIPRAPPDDDGAAGGAAGGAGGAGTNYASGYFPSHPYFGSAGGEKAERLRPKTRT